MVRALDLELRPQLLLEAHDTRRHHHRVGRQGGGDPVEQLIDRHVVRGDHVDPVERLTVGRGAEILGPHHHQVHVVDVAGRRA